MISVDLGNDGKTGAASTPENAGCEEIATPWSDDAVSVFGLFVEEQ